MRKRKRIYYMAVVLIGKSQRQFFYKCRNEFATRGDLVKRVQQKTKTTEPIELKMLMYTNSTVYNAAGENEKI